MNVRVARRFPGAGVTAPAGSPIAEGMSRSTPFLPALAAGLGLALFGLMDATMKRASIDAGVYSALFWRSIFGTCLGLPVWRLASRLNGGAAVWPGRRALAVHVVRALVVAAMALLFFWGLVRTPMAVAMALSFIAPLIALYLAALFLGEPITRRALAASLLGLAGVAVVAAGRLGLGGGHAATGAEDLAGILAILGSAMLYAGNLVLQRHQAQMASPSEVAFFQTLVMALAMAPAAPWLAGLPSAWGLAHIALAAALALASLILLSWAYARAEAHRLLPLEYSAFVWAALMGWLWFGEGVGSATLLGVALIVVGCWIGASSGAPEHIEQTAL